MNKTALIVSDYQNEFISGNLEIPYSISLLNKINKIQRKFDYVYFTKNVNTSFKDEKENKILISDVKSYCFQDTNAINFPDGLKVNDNIYIRDYNNTFSSINSKKDNTLLIDSLLENNITHVFLVGLIGDYSIKYTAVDLNKSGFKTYVIIDLIRTIDYLNKICNFYVNNNIFIMNSDDINIIISAINRKPGENKVNDRDNVYNKIKNDLINKRKFIKFKSPQISGYNPWDDYITTSNSIPFYIDDEVANYINTYNTTTRRI